MTFKVVCLVDGGHVIRAVLCADYQVENVERSLRHGTNPVFGTTVQVVDVEEHWSAVVAHPTADAERDCRGGEP